MNLSSLSSSPARVWIVLAVALIFGFGASACANHDDYIIEDPFGERTKPTPDDSASKRSQRRAEDKNEPEVETTDPGAPVYYEAVLNAKFRDAGNFKAVLDPAAVLGEVQGQTWRLGDVLVHADFNGNGYVASWKVQGPQLVLDRYLKLLKIRSDDPASGMYDYAATESKRIDGQASVPKLEKPVRPVLIADRFGGDISKGLPAGMALHGRFSDQGFLSIYLTPNRLVSKFAGNVRVGEIMFEVYMSPENSEAVWYIAGAPDVLKKYVEELQKQVGEDLIALDTIDVPVRVSAQVEAGVEQ